MSNGEYTEESLCRLADVLDPLTSLRETVGEWQLGTFGLSRRDATFRSGYGGHLSLTSRFRKQPFGPTPKGAAGVALIFRQFDSSPHQAHPAEYFIGWVPLDRSNELDQWLAFLSSELAKRHAGTSSEQTRATYSYGNPHKPFGMGGFVVELHLDNSVHLAHTKQNVTRKWVAQALPALWKALNVGLASSGFPTTPSVRMAPAGEDSFSLSVTRSGEVSTVSGFVSPEYKDITFLFGDIVVQMSGDQVVGFKVETTTPYVTDARET